MFKPVDLKADFPEMEKKLLEKWKKTGLAKKYFSKNNSSEKYFSFIDGPITANNPMGVHHAWGRTYKDLWQRYKNMRGYCQRFQPGFDCQGLWVEVEVEKELGLKSKKDIENLVAGDKSASIAKFVNLCKERVYKYSKIQTEQSKRLAMLMDWDNAYFTLSDENNYMIWHFLKKCQEKGLIYKGLDSVPWCPRCGTAISQHEMLSEDYKEITHESVFIKYPLVDIENTFFLAWTTTPWTLIGNVALAIDPKKTYVLAQNPENKSERYYLIREAAERLKLEVVKTVSGKDLENINYVSPFDEFPRVKKSLDSYFHKVILTDEQILPVSLEEGTGVIHIAPGQGTEDFALAKKNKLPVIELIDEEANYLDDLREFSFQNAKKHPEIIVDFLTKGNFLFKTEKITHRYPACWRCKTELVWRVVDEWYIKIDPVREDMVKVAKKIKWIPGFGLKRELDWLNNMHDWLISKKRYWGLALPIWECLKCKHFEVIGGKEELKEKASQGWDKFEGNSPHRPWIDKVKIKCPVCGEDMERIPDVGNPWLDAGIVPFSTILKGNIGEPLYRKDRKEWQRWFPADFVSESFPGQFKNWFYSLIAMSTVLENMEPFKTVLGFATLFGEDGRPMHKSWGNMIEFNEGADKIGVDVMRWMYARQNPAENMLFGFKIADEVRRKFFLKLWNVYNYFVTYANLDNWSYSSKDKENSNLSVLDRWILARLNQVVKETTLLLDKYDAYSTSLSIEKFVNDLSLWYIRRSRERTGTTSISEEDRNSFYLTTHKVLVNLSKILAPIMPFVSETIFTNLIGEESVHLSDWPEFGELSKEEEKLVKEMEKVREIVEKIHAGRKELGIPVRQPLSKASVTYPDIVLSEEVLKIAEEEVNVKEIKLKKGTELSVSLDATITPALEEEAKARQLIRKIQEERKAQGLSLNSKVKVVSPWIPENSEILQKVKIKTLAIKISQGSFRVKSL